MFLLFVLPIVSAGTMIRTVPSKVGIGDSFIIQYSTSETGVWGVSIEDSVSGGCTFPDGSSSIKTVMLSADGSTKSITIQAPSVESTCTFTGDYKFGTDAIINFQSASITISSVVEPECITGTNKCIGTIYYECISENWVSQGEVVGECGIENGDGEPPTFDLNQVLFKIGDFGVTWMHLIIGFIVIFALSFLRR